MIIIKQKEIINISCIKKGGCWRTVEDLQSWLNFYYSESGTTLDVDGSF